MIAFVDVGRPWNAIIIMPGDRISSALTAIEVLAVEARVAVSRTYLSSPASALKKETGPKYWFLMASSSYPGATSVLTPRLLKLLS